ncbi:hypothetical protein [Kitasatospora sp. CMC57]
MYIESAARLAAMMSAAWSSALQAEHHVMMSAGVGGVLARPIRETLELLQVTSEAVRYMGNLLLEGQSQRTIATALEV